MEQNRKVFETQLTFASETKKKKNQFTNVIIERFSRKHFSQNPLEFDSIFD